MKILLLDPQKKANYRISKDTSGAYGTGNDFGNSLIAKILKYLIKKNSDWPPYPGTPVFNEFKDKIIKNDYESFNQYNLVYKHNRFTGDQVKNYLDLAYTKYYSRVSWLYKYGKSFVRSSVIKNKREVAQW